MTSQVFYRKWRPQTLAEVAGQEYITKTLLNALLSERVSHAYLFCGPRGTGKTSTGRILAKAVNCLNNGKGEPCNECQICEAINQNRDLDLVEIDAASNTGVDDIRKLREKVNYSPDIARYKVYIIDEVHMLSTSAFNALLKTLEEPPAHVIFILATTEVHKIPLTILSRCQRFDFRRIPQKAITDRLAYICNAEEITIDPDALALIAKASVGSLRDAENLLERLTIYGGKEINLEQVKDLLGMTGDQRVGELCKYVLNKDTASGLASINSILIDGIDPRQFTKELVEYLRSILIIKVGAEETLDLSSNTINERKVLANGSSVEEILRAIKLFGQINIRSESQSTLPLELALVEFALQKEQKGEPDTSPKMANKAQVIEKKISYSTTSQPDIPKSEQRKQNVASTQEIVAELPLADQNIEYFQKRWSHVIQALKGVGSTGNLDALLRSACDPIALEGDTIVLGFYYPFHKDKIEDPKYRHMVEEAVNRVFGASYKLRCILTPRDKKPKSQSLVEAALEMGAKIVDEEAGGNK